VALLRGLIQLSAEQHLTLIAAHLNHGLRGLASTGDAAWVRDLCGIQGVPLELGSVNLGQPEAISGVEEVARLARLQFLEESAIRHGCPVIATAHTADDQAETVLHHLVRGSGLSGLRGIPETRTMSPGVRLVRPLLQTRRVEVEAYLRRLGQDHREDATNADVSLTRNWLRHKLLPDLHDRFGGHVTGALARLARQVGEVEEVLVDVATRWLDRIRLDQQPDIVRLDPTRLSGLKRHLVREIFLVLWRQQNWPRQGMGFADWDRLAEVALSAGDINLPGRIRVRQERPGLLVLQKTDQ